MKSLPPLWADRILEWYCNPALLEEIQGDLHEIYDRQNKNRGKHKANLAYIWNVIRFFRWSNIRRQKSKYSTNSTAMFKNFLLMGFRSSMRNGLTTLINILGLSLGIAGAITISSLPTINFILIVRTPISIVFIRSPITSRSTMRYRTGVTRPLCWRP